MLIAVEGGDGTGKTAFAEALIDRLGPHAKLLHFSQPKHESIFTEYECLDNYDPLTQDIICDRYHLGELIYGPIYRGESKLDAAGLMHVELYLRARGCLLVHLDAKDQTIYDRIYGDTGRGEDFLQKAHVQVVLQNYRNLTATSLLRTLHYSEDVPMSVEWTLQQARIMARRARPLMKFKSYIGNERPRILLLGEKKGSLHLGDHAAAFVPYPSTSGHYLLSGLSAAGVIRVGIANALEEDLPALVHTLAYPPVVALGRHASSALKQAEIPHGVVPHPQFVRRFHNKKQEEYVALITDVAYTRRDFGSWPKS